MTAALSDRRDQLFTVMATALRAEAALDQLAALSPLLPLDLWRDHGADVLLCWTLHGRTPSATIIQAAIDGSDGRQPTLEGEANAWSVRVLTARFGQLPDPPLPPRLHCVAAPDWVELGDWFARTSTMALPGRGGLGVAEHALELVRAVAHELLVNHPGRAGALLRWLAVQPTAADRLGADALNALLEQPRPAPQQAFAALVAHALWAKRPGPVCADTLRSDTPAQQPTGAPAQLIAPALDWLTHHLGEFTAHASSFRKLGELALLGDLLISQGAARGRPSWSAFGQRIVRQAWDQLEHGNLLLRAIEATPALSLSVTAVAPMFHRGLRNEALENAIARHAASIPRPLAYLASLPMHAMGLALPWTVDEAFSWTMVGRGLPPWRLSALEQYLLPHIAWYEVNFSLPHEPRRSAEYLRRWLPVWLLHCEELGLNDLLAEMIVAWHAVTGECCPPRAWATLLAAQRPDGSIAFSRGGHPTDDYHSTIVTAMAALWCRH